MSIIIKGMNKPKRCPECPFLQENYDVLSGLLSLYCSLDAFEIEDFYVEDITEAYEKIEKQKHCPIIEVLS